MVVYDTANIDGELCKSAYCFLSNENSHCWYSAVPACQHYIKLRETFYNSRDIALHANTFWSDKGKIDFWTSPFIAYASDITSANDINLNMNTNAGGHSKYICGQIGSTVVRKIKYACKHGYIVLD